MTQITTKEMSELTGVSIATLRYYERIGLLDPVKRASNGHRRYGDNDLRRVDFLKRLRATGMSITEMQYYVDLFREGDDTIVERREMLEAHREAVHAQVDALNETLALLNMKIENYRREERQLQSESEKHDHQRTNGTHHRQQQRTG